ncbi:hypothetical protein AYO22_10607 [Fonsecaea multimorphosa]|nr:hypothetical protein AYO22_10607 [Fonsecaea multimorphosa]
MNQQDVPKECMFTYPHNSHALLFQEIIRNGGSIACAVQSVLTVLVSLDFYDHLPAFNKGLMAVLIVLVVHLVVCLVVTSTFAAQICGSQLGNEWQRIAQVIGPANLMKNNVDKMLKSIATAGDLVILAENQQNGALELQQLSSGLWLR